MKNMLFVNTIRKIKDTHKKFISLMCMSLLGVGFFVGIKSSSPNMLDTINTYLKDNNVYDIEITSTLGLTDNDINALEDLNIGSIYRGKYTDTFINLKTGEKTLRTIALSDINKVILKEGNLPSNNDEIVVEKSLLTDNDLHIGDTIKIDNTSLESNTYKITGVVESPLYFTDYRGTTSIGKGSLDYYSYVLNDDFKTDYYTNIYVKLDTKYSTNSTDYNKLVNDTKMKIEKIKDTQEDLRYNDIYKDYIKYYETLGITDYQDKLTKSTWYIKTRNDNNAYKTYINSCESLSKIGNVFPLVFFLVALLISFISISRMIEEDRLEIGTLKGLGYSNFSIYLRNIFYSFLAVFLGSIIGMLIGFNLLPRVVWYIYASMFTLGTMLINFNWYYALIGLGLSTVLICGSSFITTKNILKEKTASLLQPKSPKVGKKIFLEDFKFWSKLNFSTKITIRNIFRYKGRIMVTIIGLAGSTALLLVGFGVKDAVSDIVDFNDNKVFVYDKSMYLASNYNIEEVNSLLSSNPDIIDRVNLNYKQINLYNSNKDYLEVNLIVPEDKNSLDKVIHLNDINNKKKMITLKDGIVLSEKLAKELKVKVGDKVSLLVNDKYEELNIDYIVENYINDYAYLSKDTYVDVFGNYDINSIYLNVSDTYDDTYDKEYLSNSNIVSIINKKDTSNVMEGVLDKLNYVVLILIIASALLAAAILYNLSSINISERRREISTLKVLGFYNDEVDRYITNENYFITVIGIIWGLVLGYYLCFYLLNTCEPEYLMFVRHIKWYSYLISALISCLFTIIVSFITHYNLIKIDMISSLKSNE